MEAKKQWCFSIWFAYYHIMENMIHNAHLKEDGIWNCLWRLKAPHKMKLFLSRIARNVIPSRWSLSLRGVTFPLTCPFCDDCIETNWHIFMDCSQANIGWNWVYGNFFNLCPC